MKDKYNTIVKIGVGLSLVAIIITMINNRGLVTGDWDLINAEFITMFTWLFALGVAIVYFLQSGLDALRCILFSSIIGISISVLIGYMYNNNIWFDTVIVGDNLLWEVQLIIVITWIIVGIIKGVADNG